MPNCVSRVMAFVVFSAACLTTEATLQAAQAKHLPNIVLIISDDHHWVDYGFMGHKVVNTPHLDQLASEGLTFRRGYVPSSLCSPSLSTILTGKFPHHHGITSNDPPLPAKVPRAQAYALPQFREGREIMSQMLDAQDTLPKLLAQRGYLSLQTGKWWQGAYQRGGFTHGMTTAATATGGRHGDEGLVIGRETMDPIRNFVRDATKQKKPYFVWYAPMLPHSPHNPPERLLKKYLDRAPSPSVAKYWASVEWFDESIGQLRQIVAESGQQDNTVFAYVADNGYIQDPKKDNQFAPRSKQSPYDGGLRTPIIIHWQGRVPSSRIDTPVSSVDLVPTLLAAAEIPVPAGLPGINLMNDTAVRQRETIYGACFTHDAVSLTQPLDSLRYRWCLSKGLKLIEPHERHEPRAKVELYDLQTDPYEERDLAAQRPSDVARLKALLDDWQPEPDFTTVIEDEAK